jgi:hypothetical protein
MGGSSVNAPYLFEGSTFAKASGNGQNKDITGIHQPKWTYISLFLVHDL